MPAVSLPELLFLSSLIVGVALTLIAVHEIQSCAFYFVLKVELSDMLSPKCKGPGVGFERAGEARVFGCD